MKTPLSRMRRHLTYANVISIIVIVTATTSSAYAASRIKMYTGKNFKDSSLTGIDFKDRSIEAKDLSAAAKSALKGRTGAAGVTGDKGAAGPQGDTGDTGDLGKEAHSLVRYASFYSPKLRTNANDATPNAAADDWDEASYAAYDNAAPNTRTFANITEFFPDSDFEQAIDHTDQVLLQLTGQNEVTTGTIRPTAGGLLSATATITVLHTNDGESNFTGGSAFHNRLRCTLRYANNDNALGAGSPTLGTPEWVSSSRQHKVYTITLTGSEKITADATANYNVGVSCADVDRTGDNHWTYVAGNVTAHAIWVGP